MTGMTRRRACTVALAGLTLAASGRGARAQRLVVRVGGTPNYGPVLPIMAAQKLGLFDKAGVSVEFTGYQGGGASMEAMAAGEADIINYFPPGIALAMNRGVKARIVSAGTITPRGWWIMARKESGITRVQDLVGKRVGTSAPGAATDFFALWAQSQSGGTFTRVPVGGAGLIPNLAAGNVDAVVAFPPVSYAIENRGLGRTVVDLGAAMKPNLPDVWAASEAAIATNKDGIRRFLTAFYGAVRSMQEHRDWTIAFLKDTAKLSEPVAEAEFSNTIAGLSRDGAFEEQWVAESLALATLAGLKDLPPVGALYTKEFVPVAPLAL